MAIFKKTMTDLRSEDHRETQARSNLQLRTLKEEKLRRDFAERVPFSRGQDLHSSTGLVGGGKVQTTQVRQSES